MKQSRRAMGIVWMGIATLVPMQGATAEVSVGAEKVAQGVRETIETTKQYTAQQKEAFEKKAQEELSVIQKQIIILQGKANAVSSATRAELQASISELEKKKDAVKNKLDELRSATDAAWNDVKGGLSAALDGLNNSYRRVLSHLP